MKRTGLVVLLLLSGAVALFLLRDAETGWRDQARGARESILWWAEAGRPDIADAMIAMPDGTRLATDVYLAGGGGLAPVVLMRLPYGKRNYAEIRFWIDKLSARGFAMVIQDMRGRYGSEGEFAPYPNEGADGAATIDWIVAQPWSNGRVGSIGCSALGESQLMLAKQNHPAHLAMVPMASGGAIGSAGGSYGYFGLFEGGIFNLASGFGWFANEGGKTRDQMNGPVIDYRSALTGLPVIGLVAKVRPDPTDFEAFMRNFENPGFWRVAGYVDDSDRFSTPSLFVDTWHDLGISSALVLAENLRRVVPQTYSIIGAGTHCDYLRTAGPGAVGQMMISPRSRMDYVDIVARFLDHFLNDGPDPKLAPVTYYMMVADEWLTARQWPPETASPLQLFLSSDGKTGLTRQPQEIEGESRAFVSDPFDPVPTIGGAICCTGDPNLISGPAYQNEIEARPDVLTYTSDPLERPLRIAGPISALLQVSTDVPDTDLVVNLTDVDPAGRSMLVQQGALRLRYRDGFAHPVMMQPGVVYAVTVQMRDIAYRVEAGHRLRLDIAGSSFPRLMRNMNTGGNGYDETTGQPARITIHSAADRRSALNLFVLAD